MKKILGFLFIFLSLSFFASGLSLEIGLVVFVSLIAAQLIVNSKKSLKWDRFESLNSYGDSYDQFLKANIIFNLSKIITLNGLILLISKNVVSFNVFNGLIISIVISLIVVAMLAFFLFVKPKLYAGLRAVLAIILTVISLTFAYLYFKTQAVWVTVLLFSAWTLFDGFSEIEIALKIKKREFGLLIIIASILFCLVSTVIQFQIGMVIITPSLIIIGVFWVLIKKAISDYKKRQIEKLEKIKSDERTKELRKKANEKERILNEKIKMEIDRIKNLTITDNLSKEDLLFICDNFKKALLTEKEIELKLLLKIILSAMFVVISNTKKQIFFPNNLENVLEFYNCIYRKIQDDEVLEGLIKVINELYDNLKITKTYFGYTSLMSLIKNKCDSFPRFSREMF